MCPSKAEPWVVLCVGGFGQVLGATIASDNLGFYTWTGTLSHFQQLLAQVWGLVCAYQAPH